jgi:trans-2,3-dihydro-3-hydroxyanthranilate isomerase
VHRYVVVDVFTDLPLRGNPVAVFFDGSGLREELMQQTARELNLSETVFVLPVSRGADADARIRIFTPFVELPFAGHPVLGSAFVLGEGDLVRLQTGAGVVPVALRRENGDVVFGEMEQPVPAVERFDHDRQLLTALGVERSELPIEAYRNGPVHVYVELSSAREVAALRPDLRVMRELGEFGVSCFAPDGGGVKTRMFAPALGVPEDPATGSAAGPLAVHLARHGRVEFGQRIEIHQGEEIGRPSVLFACAEGTTSGVQRVTVGGSAVIVGHGEYRLD